MKNLDINSRNVTETTAWVTVTRSVALKIRIRFRAVIMGKLQDAYKSQMTKKPDHV